MRRVVAALDAAGVSASSDAVEDKASAALREQARSSTTLAALEAAAAAEEEEGDALFARARCPSTDQAGDADPWGSAVAGGARSGSESIAVGPLASPPRTPLRAAPRRLARTSSASPDTFRASELVHLRKTPGQLLTPCKDAESVFALLAAADPAGVAAARLVNWLGDYKTRRKGDGYVDGPATRGAGAEATPRYSPARDRGAGYGGEPNAHGAAALASGKEAAAADAKKIARTVLLATRAASCTFGEGRNVFHYLLTERQVRCIYRYI